jgi:competence protein ComGC
LAIFILIAEDLTGMNALLKSREYVKGKWGGVFWRLFFMGVLSLIISSVLNLISWLLQIPFGLIITLFWVPLAMTYSFLIYSNLKSLKGEIVFAPTSGEKVPFILVAIFGISVIFTMLFSVIFGVFGPVSARERDKKRQADINQIRSGLELYYVKHNNYPSSLNELSSEYFLDLPVDPLTKQSYQYQLQQNGTDYKVCAQLELTKTQKCVTSQE